MMTSAKYPLPPPPACVHCGGTKSMRAHARKGLAAHNLCATLAARGMPTPSLGDDVVPTEPNKSRSLINRSHEDVTRLVRAQVVADPELIELVTSYIVETGSCVWHAVAVCVGCPCSCAECSPPKTRVAVRS